MKLSDYVIKYYRAVSEIGNQFFLNEAQIGFCANNCSELAATALLKILGESQRKLSAYVSREFKTTWKICDSVDQFFLNKT